METVQLRYDQQARERQVAIIGSCGFDSLVADYGVECIRQDCERKNLSKSCRLPFLNQHLQSHLDLAYIESFLALHFGQVTVR